MAAYSAVPAARNKVCGRLALEPQIRSRPGKLYKGNCALRLGLNFRDMRNCGRFVARAAICKQAEDKQFLRNGGLQSFTLYDFLGLPQNATQKNIKEAYRKSAKIWHPDIAMKGKLKDYTQAFLKIHDAYVVLSDPVARARYDTQLRLESLHVKRMNSRFPGIVSFDQSNGDNSGDCYFTASWTRNWETDQCW